MNSLPKTWGVVSLFEIILKPVSFLKYFDIFDMYFEVQFCFFLISLYDSLKQIVVSLTSEQSFKTRDIFSNFVDFYKLMIN